MSDSDEAFIRAMVEACRATDGSWYDKCRAALVVVRGWPVAPAAEPAAKEKP
jgi:hypothetical protein